MCLCDTLMAGIVANATRGRSEVSWGVRCVNLRAPLNFKAEPPQDVNASPNVALGRHPAMILSPVPPVLSWHRRFAVGVEELDRDHRIMLDFINLVCAAWQNTDQGAALAVFEQLYNFSEEHFRREEGVLRGIFSQRHVLDHTHEHRVRLHQLQLLGDRLRSLPAPDQSVGLTSDLVDWFLKQSIGHDAAIKAFFDHNRKF